MSPMKKYTTNKAFTLVELIISIAIIAILLITGLSMISFTITTIDKEGANTSSFYEAQDAMERLMAGESPNAEGYSKINWTIETKTIENVEGNYYEIKEKATNKLLLKGFVPNE